MQDTVTRDQSANSCFLFGDFMFDAHRRELHHSGRKIDLNPQPARLLEALLRRAPDIVSRDTLQKDLWGGKATVEFEQSLNTCIGQLRAALGESARDPIYIKTEPKIGYRLLPPVTIKRSNRRRRAPVYAAVMAAVAVIVAVGAFYSLKTPTKSGLLQAGDPQIQDLVLRGRSLRVFGDADAMKEGLTQFERALALAPDEPAALSGGALNLAVLAGVPEYPVSSTYARAQDLAARALSIDPNAVDARLARGFIALYDRWDIASAHQDFEQARRLAPNYALTHSWLAAALSAGGRNTEAIAASERAVVLDPTSWYVRADLCWYLNFEQHYSRALDVCAGAVEREPTFLWSQLGLVEAYRGSNRIADAAELQNTIARQLGITLHQATGSDLAQAFSASACAIADAIVDKSREASAPNYLVAVNYAQCGDFDAASIWLNKAASGGESYVLFYHTDPRFAEFRRSSVGQQTHIVIEKRK